ncbi:MAG TPA: MotA/TolQ/ExbB proton channel family protein [Myxococcota bacterium]|nr:MotA/TolQ/ExbB proton channel family protein [Myxococcota bacterium]
MPDAFAQQLAAPYRALGELIHGGGPFVIWIFAAGVLLWTLVIERYWYFARVLPRESEQMLAGWRSRADHTSWRARSIRKAMISRLNAGMSARLTLMRVLVPLAPLLGLLGTVGGMLEVFESMAIRGSADAQTMASGVSHAMICTMTGLAVSITGLYPVFYFGARTRQQTELLADHFEF